MYCSKCGANVADGTAFCSACGQPMVGFSVGQAAAVPAAAAPATQGYAQPAWPIAAASPAVAYAGFWLRFVAWIIDRIVLQIASSILLLPFGASLGLRQFLRNHPPSSPEELFPLFTSMGRIFLLTIVLTWLYYALLESSVWQATLGKKALGLEVTDSIRPGHRPLLCALAFGHDPRNWLHHGGIHGKETSAARYSCRHAGHP
jgi:uncharacterized RDD family membrane protein YckC